MENSIFDVWRQVYPSLADCILLGFVMGMFFWFRSSIKGAIKEFKEELGENAKTVREQLDSYNKMHEKSWVTLAELVQELKDKKVWQAEYLLQIDNLKEKGIMRDERIKDFDERLKCIERGRRETDN